MTFDTCFATIAELAPAIQSGALRSVDLTERLLDRIGRLNGALHAIVGLTRERALAEAAAADAMIGTGDYLGPLHGIPYLAKAQFDVAGEVTAAGMSVPAGSVAARRASAPTPAPAPAMTRACARARNDPAMIRRQRMVSDTVLSGWYSDLTVSDTSLTR